MQIRFSAILTFILASATTALLGQAPAPKLEFEVASVKIAPPLDPAKIMTGKLHIGMKVDAARVDIGNLSLSDLIRTAYRVKPHQISGPDWMSTQRFDIMAKMPEGATKEHVPEMLQALLAERFKLAIHHDRKEQSVYALVVGKNGHKMKEAAPDPPPAPATDGAAPAGPPGKGGMVVGSGEGQVRINQNTDGKGMTIASGQLGQMKIAMGEGGNMRMEFAKLGMSMLADMVSRFVDRPVVDMTELKGNYQVVLDLSMEELRNMARVSGMAAGIMMPGMGGGGADSNRPADAASAPAGTSIFAAVQNLGLKLDARKSPIDTIVVDHLEKTPTEN